MDKLNVRHFGPIDHANVKFGDLTLLVGPQASGKSIFLQLLKLLVDKRHIRKVFNQYSYSWGQDADEILDLYFGDGMHGVWNSQSEIKFGKHSITKEQLLPRQKESFKNASEQLFYVPAQRILSLADGRPRFFTEFDETVPYVLRYFSETLRQLMQGSLISAKEVFPKSQRLKTPLREAFSKSIFHDARIVIDEHHQKKFRMQVNGMNIPFMTWSAGQKEFMPLLLSFYWLCTSSKISRRDDIQYVVIEEPEMGLHPQAIKSVILQIIDLLSRGYQVVISTHSPVLLEFAWAFNYLKASEVGDDALFDLFELRKTQPTKRLFNGILESKSINTYYFKLDNNRVNVQDISSLDAASDDPSIAEWGGLSEFAGRAADIVSKYFTHD